MTEVMLTEQQWHARERLEEARNSIRHKRAEVMARMGRELHAWRERSGIKQKDLAAKGLVSATVVRRIEKGDVRVGAASFAHRRCGAPWRAIQ